MTKTSGDFNRRLQPVECFEQDNGLFACVEYDYPGEGLTTIYFDCPVYNGHYMYEWGQSCSIVLTDGNTPNEIDLDAQCLSCGICSVYMFEGVDFDCSNIIEGDCSIRDCNGDCSLSIPPPPTCRPGPSTTPPSTGPDECVDYPDWHDDWDFGCFFYTTTPDLCEYSEPGYNGYTAEEACCVCGGGIRGTNPPTEDVRK